MNSSIPFRTCARACGRAFAASLLVLLISVSCWSQAGKVEQIGPLAEPSVPEAVRAALSVKGYRVTSDDAAHPIEIWYRKDTPAQPKGSSSAVYDRLTPSALVGVLHFTKASSDFRGQSVVAGFYTLRAALMPDDGNHLGVAPSRDFLLLVPAAADPEPDAAPKFPDLVALSRQASGTKHPAPLSLVPAEAGALPAITRDDEGHVVFTVPIHLTSGEDIPIALIVKGTASQ